MTDWKKVNGSQSEKPAEFDTITSPNVAYQRRNIERITQEQADGSRTALWQYDEREMTPNECAALQRDKTQQEAESANAVAGIVFVTMAESGQLDDVTAGEHAELFAEWEPDVAYTSGAYRRYNGALYRCLTSHTSQPNWTPDAAPSLWKTAADPTEDYPAWSQPVGAADAYNAGDKVSHNGKKWRSDIDANVWEPSVYGWTEVE